MQFQDVVFPSMTVCNLNQVEASFLRELNVYGNATMTNLLFNEFIHGHHRNLSEEGRKVINDVLQDISSDNSSYYSSFIHTSFLERSSQSCNNLFTSVSFRKMNLTSNKIPDGSYVELIPLGPGHFSTDFGSCCSFVPHLNLKPFNMQSVEESYHGLKADALNGETNGLNFLLDAEQFNYAYYDSNSAGFKISLHSHLDKPMIQFSSQFIFVGTENQINLKPSLSYTTDNAISTFTPEERGCYADGEANLTYLPYWLGYHYEMNNCLIDQGIRDIVWNCRCIPSFGLSLDAAGSPMDEETYIPRCRGEKLHCANARKRSLGMEFIATENDIIVPEAMKSPNKIGNISKPKALKCMPACKVQENNNQVSIAAYPQQEIFFHQKMFCDVASHIWQKTCQDENKAYFLNKKQPLLCRVLKNFDDFFGKPRFQADMVNATCLLIKRLAS